MRGQNHVVETSQRRSAVQRLLLKYVEPGPTQLSRGQGGNQRPLVHDCPTRGIDENGVGLHQSQFTPANQTSRLRCKSAID